MAKSKKLSIAAINKLNSELNQQKTICVCGDYEVHIDKIFRPSKIQAMLAKYLQILQNIKKEEKVDDSIAIGIAGIINVLIIETFTDVPCDISAEDVRGAIKLANTLLDLGIVEKCLGSFDSSEMEKLNKMIQDVVASGGKVMAELALQMELEHGGKKDQLDDEFKTYSNIIEDRLSDFGDKDANSEESE